MEEREDKHNIGILLGGRHDVQVVGLDVGKGVLPGLDDWRDEAWKGDTRGLVIRWSCLWHTW